jgi:hypothetical protein
VTSQALWNLGEGYDVATVIEAVTDLLVAVVHKEEQVAEEVNKAVQAMEESMFGELVPLVQASAPDLPTTPSLQPYCPFGCTHVGHDR